MTESARIDDEKVRDRGAIDLDENDVRLAEGTRLTEARADELAVEFLERAGRGRPSLSHSGGRSPRRRFSVPDRVLPGRSAVRQLAFVAEGRAGERSRFGPPSGRGEAMNVAPLPRRLDRSPLVALPNEGHCSSRRDTVEHGDAGERGPGSPAPTVTRDFHPLGPGATPHLS